MPHIAETFRALHVKSDPLIMVNVWDRGTAKLMQAAGAKALATSSAAHAYVMGRPDGGTVTRDEALAHAAEIVGATDLPVQGDFENGFGDAPETCAETVRLAAEAGLAGICIEDIVLPSDAAYDFDLAVERIRAAAAAARALPHDFVLTARADGIMTGAYDTDEAIRRLQGFEAAGADCLYAPLPPDMAEQARIVASVDAPVNVLVSGRYAAEPLQAFAEMGAARISLGAALARVTQRALLDAGKAMLAEGDFTPLRQSIASDEIDAMLSQ